MIPDFEHEKKFWQKGYRFVAGVDEVGRGAWAGPLVACAVVLHPDVISDNTLMEQLKEIRDSKKLSSKKRQQFSSLLLSNIKDRMLNVGIGSVPPQIIDRDGVTAATGKAMRAALRNLKLNYDHVLVDAFPIPGLAKRDHTPIKQGDEQSITIAAASIIAKEWRDELMRSYAQQEKLAIYGWQTNVGYGTKEHREAIATHGICKHHRKLFVPEELYSSD